MTKNKTRTFVHTAILMVSFLPLIIVILTTFRDPSLVVNSDVMPNFFMDYTFAFDFFSNIRDTIEIAFESIPILDGGTNAFLMATTCFSNLIGFYVLWVFAESLLFIPKFALKMIRRFTDV